MNTATPVLQHGPCPISKMETELEAVLARIKELENEFLLIATNPFNK